MAHEDWTRWRKDTLNGGKGKTDDCAFATTGCAMGLHQESRRDNEVGQEEHHQQHLADDTRETIDQNLEEVNHQKGVAL